MSRRALLLAAAAVALASGCNQGSSGPAFRLAEPSSVTLFWGYSHKSPGALHPYAAVANSGQDELVVFDPVDDAVVPAPILIRPVSIPLPAPRPAIVASAPFTAPPGSVPRPDLLVVVAAASSELQLIRTWQDPDQVNRPDPGLVPEAAVDLVGEVVALVATPTVDANGTITPDSVRVIAALADGRLAVVEYQWTPATSNPSDPTGAAAPVTTRPQPDFQAPGFHALSLAVDAAVDGGAAVAPPARPPLRNPRFLYAATLDILPSNTLGVAELDMAGSPGSWTIRALNAHAPTRLVAAFTLWERATGIPGAYDQINIPAVGLGDESSFQGTAPGAEADPVHRVYAYRDPASCGVNTPELCGIAVLDPATGDVLEDPWHPGQTPKQYLPPIAIPSIPVALVPGSPAWNPPAGDVQSESDPLGLHRFVEITTAGLRLTTGVLLVPSQDGRSYFADLARWEVPSNTYEINLAGTLASVISYRPSPTDRPQIGFYYPKDVADSDATNGSTARNAWEPTITAEPYFKLTPGFTPDDLWSVTYQGYLPAFAANRPAIIGDDSVPAGMLRVAVQASPSSQVVNVFDPALGVRVGDIVEVWTLGMSAAPGGANRCPDTTTTDLSGNGIAPIEGKIVEVTRPDEAHPGGSLVIQPGDCVPVATVNGTQCDGLTHGPWTDPTPGSTYQYNGCWGALAGTAQQVRIRASGGGNPADTTLDGKDLVLIGTGTGYAGRVTSIPLPATPQPPAFRFSNDDEGLACPLIPFPSNSAPLAIPDCDQACRLACERAAIARRARRLHLTSVYCYKASTESPDTRNYCETYFPEFAVPQASTKLPLGSFDGTPPVGPALAFSLGVQQPAVVQQTGSTIAPMMLVRDTQVIFATRSGHVPSSRYGGGANSGPATGPAGAAYFDRSYDVLWNKQGDRFRFFVPYVGNLILDASPTHTNSDTRVLR